MSIRIFYDVRVQKWKRLLLIRQTVFIRRVKKASENIHTNTIYSYNIVMVIVLMKQNLSVVYSWTSNIKVHLHIPFCCASLCLKMSYIWPSSYKLMVLLKSLSHSPVLSTRLPTLVHWTQGIYLPFVIINLY